jgi:hypothetical protein
MPRIEVRADEVRIVMPWDPGYATTPGEGLHAGGVPPHLLRRDSCATMAATAAAPSESEGPGHDVPARDPAG